MRLAFAFALLFFSPNSLAESKYLSPDGKSVAIVQSLKNGELYITVQNSAGKFLADLNLASQDAEHGRTLAKAAWARNSAWFVLTTESSGGHSPWHFRAYFYSRATETFRNLDARSGLSVADPGFTIADDGTLSFRKYNFDRGEAEPARISLPRLDRR